MSKIRVTANTGDLSTEYLDTDEITDNRESLNDYLTQTATGDYRAAVLNWYDNGHEDSFNIHNGPTDEDVDTWEVVQ